MYRMMGVAALTAAGLTFAPAAWADDAQYLADLHQPLMAHPQIPDSGLVAVGHDVCNWVSGGMTPVQARAHLLDRLGHGGVANTSNAEAGTLVQFALQDLCPGHGGLP
jgi:Protein of unknown function (DUF732)